VALLGTYNGAEALVAGSESGEVSSFPSCHAILYDVNGNGIMLDAGSIGGGEIVDFGTIDATIAEIEVGNFKPKCGDLEYGQWSKAKETFGGFTLPVIAWVCFRFTGFAVEYLKTYGELNEAEGWFAKCAFDMVIWLVFGVGATVLISGMNNLEVSENHPQLMVTYFSPKAQYYITIGSGFILLDVLCLACVAWKFKEVPEASSFFGQLFSFCFFVSQTLMQEARDREAREQDPGWFRIAAAIAAAPPGILVVFILACLVYKLNELSFDYSLVLGFGFHLALRFPTFSLSATINALHVCSTLLCVLDTLDGLLKSCKQTVLAFMLRPVIKRLPDRLTGLHSQFKGQNVWLKHKIERSKEHQFEQKQKEHDWKTTHPTKVQVHPQTAQSGDVGTAIVAGATDMANAMGAGEQTGRRHPCFQGPEGSPGCKMHCSKCNQYFDRLDITSGCVSQCTKCQKFQQDCPAQICYTQSECKVCKAVEPTKRRCTDKKCYAPQCQAKGVLNPEFGGDCCQKNYDECSLAEKKRAVRLSENVSADRVGRGQA